MEGDLELELLVSSESVAGEDEDGVLSNGSVNLLPPATGSSAHRHKFDPLTQPSPKRTCAHLGLICAALSSLFFSLSSAIVKELDHISPFQLAACRFVGVVLPTLPLLATQTTSLGQLCPSGYRLTLLLRSLLGTGSLVMQFYAIRHMPLADASVIIFSVPVFVAIFARIFLKEPCGIASAACIVLTSAGVLLIARPPFIFDNGSDPDVHRSWKGALVALGGTILGANVYIVLRLLKGVPSPVILLNFGLVAVAMTVGATVAAEGRMCMPECGHDRLLVLALGAFSFGGQILLTLALKWEQAGPVSIARTADIVFAFAWQVLFFGEAPTIWSISGAVLVTCSVLITGVRKWVSALPEDAPARRTLGWLDK